MPTLPGARRTAWPALGLAGLATAAFAVAGVAHFVPVTPPAATSTSAGTGPTSPATSPSTNPEAPPTAAVVAASDAPAPTVEATATGTPTDACRLSDVAGAWQARFASVEAARGGALGASVVTAHGRVIELGTWRTGAAWSTAKVPLAIAVTRADGGQLSPSDGVAVSAAIQRSDNDAAATLWQRLGSGTASATAVQDVLRDAGDGRTTVPPAPPRPGYSAVGQTQWSLTDQASFALRLTSLRGSDATLAAMRDIAPEQRWGLGRLGVVSAFKGGWGPGEDGGYLARQFGVASSSGGPAGVAVAARTAGGFGDAIAGTDAAAGVVAQVLAELPAEC